MNASQIISLIKVRIELAKEKKETLQAQTRELEGTSHEQRFSVMTDQWETIEKHLIGLLDEIQTP
jgi:hypothetical protein